MRGSAPFTLVVGLGVAFAIGRVREAPAQPHNPDLTREVLDPPPSSSTPTTCFGMHCCPTGYAMRGARMDHDRLLCTRVLDETTEDCFVDHPTRRGGVHACPAGTYMRGVARDAGRLACCFHREAGFTEYADHGELADPPAPSVGAHQDNGMHACPARGPAVYMTGIDVPTNKFLCSAVPAQRHRNATVPPTLVVNPERPRSYDLYPTSQIADWQKITRNWLARMMDLPIDYETAAPPAYVVEGTENVATRYGVVVRKRIHFPSAVDGAPVPAYLLFPPNYDPHGHFPALVFTHGHYSAAKKGVAGAPLNPPLRAGLRPEDTWGDGNQSAAFYFAQHGFVALAADTRSFGDAYGEYPVGGRSHEDTLASLPIGALPQMWMKDGVRNTALLASIPGVDPSRVFAGGLSLGGSISTWLAALDTRVQAVVNAGNFKQLDLFNSPLSAQNVDHQCQTIPGLSTDPTDFRRSLLVGTKDFAALTFPRRMFIMWGQADDGYLTKHGDTVTSEAQAAYARLGRPSAFHTDRFRGMGHEWRDDAAYAFYTGSAPALGFDFGRVTNWADGLDPAGYIWDYQDSFEGIHACAAGHALVGMTPNLGHPYFRWANLACRSVAPPSRETCTVDRGTQRNGMHACPPTQYVRGVDNMRNLLVCCKADTPPTAEWVDPITETEAGMHVCRGAEHAVVTGVRADRDMFLCGHM